MGNLYRDYGRNVARWAARLGGADVEVEDIVQETFLIAQRQLPTFRGDASMLSWLFAITYNLVRSHRRREKFRRLVRRDMQLGSRELRQGPTPVEQFEQRQSLALVYRALDGLAEKYRVVFILHEIEGTDGPQIAELLNLNIATLRVRLFRARSQFLKRFAALEQRGEGEP